MLSELINYDDVLFVLQQHFRICLWCQCINLVSSSPSFLSGLRYPSCHLNSTTASDADPDQSPDAQEETCFSLGPSGKPSCPSAITPCFLNTAQCFDPHLLVGSPSSLWLEEMQFYKNTFDPQMLKCCLTLLNTVIPLRGSSRTTDSSVRCCQTCTVISRTFLWLLLWM